MPQLIIENFAKQDTNPPSNALKMPNYTMFNVDPFYTKRGGGGTATQEAQYAPLAAAFSMNSIQSGLDGNITMFTASPNLSYSCFGVTANNHVYAFDSYYDLGKPSSAGANSGGQLAVFNNNLIYTNSLDGSVYKMDLGTRAWTTTGGSIVTSTGNHYLCPFLDFCAVIDGDVSLTYGHLVRKITSAWTITTGIDLGTGWGAVGQPVNYNNQYLLIPAGYLGGSNYGSNYLFMWNGISTRYNYAIQIPGKFIDGWMINGTYVCAIYTYAGSVSFYYLNSLKMKWLADFPYAAVTKLSNFGTSLTFSTPYGLVVMDEITSSYKSQFFLSNVAFNQVVSGGPNNTLYASVTNAVYSYSSLNAYNIIYYTSQYLPTKNGESGTLNWIKIYYDTPPKIAGDTIGTTVYVVDENGVAGSLANGTYNLSNITSTSYLSPKYTLLDCQGIDFDKVKVGLTVTPAGGTTWVPIVRKIVIDYEQ